jgi:hypothetical protein
VSKYTVWFSFVYFMTVNQSKPSYVDWPLSPTEAIRVARTYLAK